MKRDTYIKDINGYSLFEEDEVEYVVRRVSPNYSSWGQFRTKYDGEYWIKGTILFMDNRFVVKGNLEEFEKLEEPRGREQGKRQVWFYIEELSQAKVRKIGSVEPTVREDRLRVLGIKE